MCLLRYCLLNCLAWCRRFCQCDESDDELEESSRQLRRQPGIRQPLRISDNEAVHQTQPQIRLPKDERRNRGRREENLELSMLHPPHNPFQRGERQTIRIPPPTLIHTDLGQVGRQLSQAERETL